MTVVEEHVQIIASKPVNESILFEKVVGHLEVYAVGSVLIALLRKTSSHLSFIVTIVGMRDSKSNQCSRERLGYQSND